MQCGHCGAAQIRFMKLGHDGIYHTKAISLPQTNKQHEMRGLCFF